MSLWPNLKCLCHFIHFICKVAFFQHGLHRHICLIHIASKFTLRNTPGNIVNDRFKNKRNMCKYSPTSLTVVNVTCEVAFALPYLASRLLRYCQQPMWTDFTNKTFITHLTFFSNVNRTQITLYDKVYNTNSSDATLYISLALLLYWLPIGV